MLNVEKDLEIAEVLLEWYAKAGRHFLWRDEDRNPYELIVAEILLQKTKAEKVQEIYSAFLKKYQSPYYLANASIEQVTCDIGSLGLQNRRAKTLIAVGKHLQKLEKISIKDVQMIQDVSGVGRYIVNSVSCFGFGKKVPLVDANISRIYGRLLGIKTKRDPCEDEDLWEIAKKMLPNDRVKQFNWALIDLGSLICKPKKPNCEECPFLRLCAYAKSLDIPKK